MKQILPKIIVFGISLLFFFIALVQIFLGYIKIGRASKQKAIYLIENPLIFWTIYGIPIIFGTLFLIWGLTLLFQKKKND